ncbi:MAG: sulfite exporter TauE/SafE family protein, partial [Acidobacteria bacterium]|nr:sulfite exporter TauE/SafE family protein [Acidobacteriota bacterium]
MTPLEFAFAAFALAVVAGILGALLGLGGGIIVVPALTLVLGVDIRYAIGASIVAVIATSSGSALRFLQEGLVNVRLALFLELATVSGALVGATLAGVVDHRVLYFVFSTVAVTIGVLMLRPGRGPAEVSAEAGALSRRLKLGGTCVDETSGMAQPYEVT